VSVVEAPDPEIFPGLIVQTPVIGSPLITTLPVGSEHVGCVMDPAVGAAGDKGTEFIIASTEALEVQPAVVTVKL
jgi:hypothetical protein